MKRILLASLLFATSAAFADGRKINFLTAITDADGTILTECPAVEEKGVCPVTKIPITLGAVAMRALVAPERDLAADESLKRGQLALNVYKSPGASLSAEEIALIKKQIAKGFSPLVVVRAFAVLDPQPEKK